MTAINGVFKRHDGTNWQEMNPQTTWDQITNKPATFTPSAHTHDYLPLSGGTIGSGGTSSGDSSQNPKLEIDGGIINIKNYGISLQIGAQNNGAVHFYSGGAQFYFGPSVVIDGLLKPYTNNTRDLGASSYQWNNIYGKTIYEDGTSIASKYLSLAGGNMTGDVTPNANEGTNLGSASKQFANIYGKYIYENGTSLSSKYYPLTGGAISGTVTIGTYAAKLEIGGRGNSTDTVYMKAVSTNATLRTIHIQPDETAGTAAGTAGVIIGGTVAATPDQTYKLKVVGSMNATTLYENGTSLVSKYLGINAVSDWAKASTKPSYAYNEINAGNITMGDGAYSFRYRTSSGLESGFYFHTSQSESVVFANEYSLTGWMFVNGVKPSDRTDWRTLSPTLHIAKGGVYINKLIANGETPTYNLDVNGSANASTVTIAAKATMQYNTTDDCIEFVFAS